MGMKDDYFSMMISQFKRWDAEFGMLSAKAEQMSIAAGTQYDEQLKAMQASRDAAYKKLQDIRTASESGWRGMQSGVDAAWISMKNALDKASSQSKK